MENGTIEESSETPSVLKIASMFSALSAQGRRDAFAVNGRRSVDAHNEDVRRATTAASAVHMNNTFVVNRTTVISSTENGTVTKTSTNSVRTRSRSSDSRPMCVDLKILDENKAKFSNVKALFESLERQSRQEQRRQPRTTPYNSKKRVASPSPTRVSNATGDVTGRAISDVISSANIDSNAATSTRSSTSTTGNAVAISPSTKPSNYSSNPQKQSPAPPVPPKPKMLESPRTSSCESPTTVKCAVKAKPASHCAVEYANFAGSPKNSPTTSVNNGNGRDQTDFTKAPSRTYHSRITDYCKSNYCEEKNENILPKLEAGDATSSITVNTVHQNTSPAPAVSPQKPSSLYEPYWRSNRFGRQRLSNGDTSPHERSLSPPVVNNNAETTKRNYVLSASSLNETQGKHDPGRLDITWPPPIIGQHKSPTEENKDSGVGTDSPSTSTTDSRASSAMNAAPSTTTSVLEKAHSNSMEEQKANDVQFMTKEEASVLLSPTYVSTRDVVLREQRGRTAGDDSEIRSLPSHLSIPQDVDLKRLSMCSMESSAEQSALPTDRYSIPEDMNVNWLADGHFWIEVTGLEDEIIPVDVVHYKVPSRVKFSCAPIRVFSTYTGIEYDRRNDDVDPVSASAEYELERRLEKMDIIDVELQKGPEGLGFSIIGMGVGADAGLEKLGIFVKSITPGGAVHRDGRICVCDQIVEVDGKSLVGVSQNYAASVLRSTLGVVRFKIGREKDLDSSEIAALIRQSLEQDRILRQQQQQEDIFQRRFNPMTDGCMEMQETHHQHHMDPPQYSHHHFQQQQQQYQQQQQNGYSNGTLESRVHARDPLPSTDSVFTHDEDETPEQLVDSNPHIERLMSQLRQPSQPDPANSSQREHSPEKEVEEEENEEEPCGKKLSDQEKDNENEALSVEIPAAAATENASGDSEQSKCSSAVSAFRNDSQSVESGSNVTDSTLNGTYTAAEDISRLLCDSMHEEDIVTRFPSSGAEPETICNRNISPSFLNHSQSGDRPAASSTPTLFGQLRRTTPDLTSSMDSMDGSEIQVRINHLEAELGDIRKETDKYQTLLNDSQSLCTNLEKKYCRAKKLIKDYQDREKDLLDREDAHLRQLREKDQQYANLVKLLNDKVVLLERQLHDAQRKRASIVEANANAVSASAASTSNANAVDNASDISPALAYLPAKKLDSGDRLGADSPAKLQRPNVSANTHIEVHTIPTPLPKLFGAQQPDFGVPATELLDSTAAKCKVEVIKQSQVMSARALPTRRRETEVIIMCHHTMEHAHALRAHASGSCLGPGACSAATVAPCSSIKSKSAASPGKVSVNSASVHSASINSAGASPVTPRRSLAQAFLLRKKIVGGGGSPNASSTSRHIELTTPCGVGGGDLDKVPAVLTWTCDDVCRFIKTLGLEKYTPEFSINRVDGCKLLQLDGSKLKAMGVQNHSDRTLIKKQIKDMKAQIEKERKQLEKESRRLLKLEKEKKHMKG